MNRTTATSIEIIKETLHFSAGHFTIFSATDRENLHGHNFQVQLHIELDPGQTGLAFDYGIVKDFVQGLCDELDEKVLLPTRSPYLDIERTEQGVIAIFGEERIPFLARDVLLLDLTNITVEELSRKFADDIADMPVLQTPLVRGLTVKVASGGSQWGTTRVTLS